MYQIDRNSYIPLSKQISIIICSRILNGIYKIGDLIPSQNDLEKEFDVSRITVRQAFADLFQQGIIKSQRGKGTFVSAIPNIKNDFEHTIAGFSYDKSKFYLTETKIILIEDSQNPEALYNLNIQNSNCINIKRIRIINKKNVAIENSFLNTDYFSNVNWKNDFKENDSLYKFLMDKFNIKISLAIEKISAVIPNEEQKSILNVSSQEPILYVYRKTYIENRNTPFEYCEYAILPQYFGTISFKP